MSGVNLTEVRTRIEQERTWRVQELQILKNQLAYIQTEESKGIYRKSLTVMLYAHFEGTCKAILWEYVAGLNNAGLIVGEANFALVASTLKDVFHALRNPDSKCKVFRRELPDETKLHVFARDREFIERLPEFMQHGICIDPEDIVDAESNLKPVVLRKMLYRLGLDPELAKPWYGIINQLLRRRNNIAHGNPNSLISQDVFDELEQAVESVIQGLVDEITDAIQRESYLRTSSDYEEE